MVMACLLVFASCGDTGEPTAPAPVIGDAQRDLAGWAEEAAAAIEQQTTLEESCEAMNRLGREFFTVAEPAAIDGGAQPQLAWVLASQLSLTANEASTFCTWTTLEAGLVGETSTTMQALLRSLADALLTPVAD